MQSFKVIKDRLLANPTSPAATALYLAACKKYWEPAELLLVKVVDSSIQVYLDGIGPENLKIGGYSMGFLYQCLFHKVARSYNWGKKALLDDKLYWFPENNTVGLEIILFDVIDELEITFAFEGDRERVIRIPKDEIPSYEMTTDQGIADFIYETTGFSDLELAKFEVTEIKGSLVETGRATILLTFEGADWLGNARFVGWEQNKMESYLAQDRPRLIVGQDVQNSLMDPSRQTLCGKIKSAEKKFFSWSKKGKNYIRIPRTMPLEIFIEPSLPTSKKDQRDLKFSVQDILDTFGDVGAPKPSVALLPNGSTVLYRPEDIGDVAAIRAAKQLKLNEIRVWVILENYGESEIYYPLPSLPIA